MASRIERRSADGLLRVAGMACICLAAVAGRHMFAVAHSGEPIDESVGQLACALIAFLGLSVGLSLALLGAHLGDEIAVSSLWAPHAPWDR